MATNKKIIAFSFFLFLYIGLSMSMLQRIISEIGIKYSLNNTSVGTIITMVYVGFLITPILIGELTDKIGRKKMLLYTFIAQFAGLIISLFINSAIAVGIGFFILGMSFSTLELIVSSLLTDVSESSSARILNVSHVFFAAGTITGPFLAIILMHATGDWVYVMLASLIMSAILFAIFIKLSYPLQKYPSTNIGVHEETKLTFKLLKNKVVIILSLSILAYVAIEAGITFYVSRYIDSFKTNEIYSTLALSMFWLCVAIGRMISSRYKKDAHILIAALSILAALGLAVCLYFSGLAISIISFGIIGFGCSAMFPTIMAIGKDNFPRYTNTLFGILLSAAGLGGVLQPLLMGAVADASGLKAALAICLAPLAIIFITQVLLLSINKKSAQKNRLL